MSSIHRFLNVWIALSVLVALGGLFYSFYDIGLHQYSAKALPNMQKFLIGHVFNEAQSVGGALAFFLGLIYLLVRRLARDSKRIRRTLIILTLLGILAVFLGTILMNLRLDSGMNKLYGQYVNMQRFAVRAIISAFLNSPNPIRLAIVLIFSAVLAALSFVSAWLEKKLFSLPAEPSSPKNPKARIWIVALIVGLLLVAFVRVNKVPSAPEGSPDVIFISVDTLRADHMGAYGYARNTTPNLDNFSKTQGLLIEHHISNAPWTLPAHMSMFTGMIPSRHGVTQPLDSISASTTLFSEILKDRGYRTGGFATNILLGSSYGFAAGFDSYDVSSNWTAKVVTDYALRWLLASPKPSFLFLHMFDPHYPYTPKPPFKGLFRAPDPEVDAVQEKGFYDFFLWMNTKGKEEQLAAEALYDEEIAYTDWALGEFFQKLRATGRYDNSWIIIVSDHGEEFGERGMWGHGITLYNEMLHVPMIVKMPKNACAGARLKELDLPQTALFQLITAAAMPEAGRESEFACGPDGVPPIISSLAAKEPVIAEVDMLGPLRYTAVTPQKKLLEPVKIDVKELLKFERGFELYEVDKDPGEKTNLFAGVPKDGLAEKINALSPELHRVLCETRMKYAGKTKAGTVQLDQASIDKLRSLGYISSSGGLNEKALLDENCMPLE